MFKLQKQQQSVKKVFSLITMNPFFELTITLCIATNTAFMMFERYPMEDTYKATLDEANLVRLKFKI